MHGHMPRVPRVSTSVSLLSMLFACCVIHDISTIMFLRSIAAVSNERAYRWFYAREVEAAGRTPHSVLSPLTIQVVGQTWSSSKLVRMSTTSSLSFGSDTNGPQMKMVWHTVIASGTVSGKLLLAPHIARACDRILICIGQ
jgi:hypothetical protein